MHYLRLKDSEFNHIKGGKKASSPGFSELCLFVFSGGGLVFILMCSYALAYSWVNTLNLKSIFFPSLPSSPLPRPFPSQVI